MIVRISFLAASFLLFCVAFLFHIMPSHGQDKVLNAAPLTDVTESLSLTPYAIIQTDPDGKITPQSIVASGGGVLNGKHSTSDMISLGYSGQPVWMTIKLYNSSAETNWFMDMGRRSEGRLGYILSATAYEMNVGADGKVLLNTIKPLSNTGAYKITVPQNSEKYILLNLTADAGKMALVPLKIFSEDVYLSHLESRTSFYALLSFGLKALAIFFIAMAFARREWPLLIFGGYFAFEALAWMMHENIGAVIGPSMFDLIIPGTMLGFTLFLIAMTKVFFEIEYGSFTEKYILYGLAWLDVLATLLALFLPTSGGVAQICLLYGAPFVTITILSLMALAQSRLGQRDFRLYFIGSLFPFAGIITVILCVLGIVPHDRFTNNALWYSIIPQGLFMLWAVQKKLAGREHSMSVGKSTGNGEVLNLSRLKETKESADHTRLLRVIEKEREILAELRAKETERVEEMRAAKEAADEANRAKSAFLAVVSHEIRTPMTGVMGMVRLLLDSNITRQQRDHVMTIQESSEAMLALLNDILDFERIERGKIELENISFDLHRLIQSVVTLMSGHAAEKQIILSARMDDDLPKFVKGDPTRLRQVLLNLMGNAIKFTESGNVTLLVKNLEQNDHNAPSSQSGKYMIYFAVQDTGIGIPTESKKNLFTPFAQANSSIARKFGGTGLGLAISKGLIETMGSAININSKEGEGSTFFFTLEMARGLASSYEQNRKQPEITHEAPATPLKILVVDDNTITRKVMLSFLEQGHHNIATSSSAEDALKKINQDAFDLIFMDIELPGLKGNEATKILREHKDPVKSVIPVIAMTGNIGKEDLEQYLADGMNGFLPKPIDMDKLNFIVNEIAHKSFEREIRVPGNDPLLQSGQDLEKPTSKTENLAQNEGIFNPDMLQSLKDTIGTAQLNELLGDLIVKTDEILMAMDMATKLGDLDALAARAHELKGMAGNFGLVEISDIAAQAERQAKTSSLAGLNALIDTLPGASARAQLALKDWVTH